MDLETFFFSSVMISETLHCFERARDQVERVASPLANSPTTCYDFPGVQARTTILLNRRSDSVRTTSYSSSFYSFYPRFSRGGRGVEVVSLRLSSSSPVPYKF